MSLHQSELHKRRMGRNLGVALCLVALMVILVWLSLVKLIQTGPREGFDHGPRNSVLIEDAQ